MSTFHCGNLEGKGGNRYKGEGKRRLERKGEAKEMQKMQQASFLILCNVCTTKLWPQNTSK